MSDVSTNFAPLFPFAFEVVIEDLPRAIAKMNGTMRRLIVPLTDGPEEMVTQLEYDIGLPSYASRAMRRIAARHDTRRVAIEMLISTEIFQRLGILLEDIARSSLLPGHEPASLVTRRHFDPQAGTEENLKYVSDLFNLAEREWSLTPFEGAFDIFEIGLSSPSKSKGVLAGAFMTVTVLTPGATATMEVAIPVAVETVASTATAANSLTQIFTAATAGITAGTGVAVYIHSIEVDRQRREDSILKDLRDSASRGNCDILQGYLTDTGDYTGQVDNICGPLTRQAIKQFAEKNGLNQNDYIYANSFKDDRLLRKVSYIASYPKGYWGYRL